MSDLETVRNDLAAATDALEDLRASLREGQDVDLDAFNLMVAKTCRAAVGLPKADAVKVRPQLERLLGRLNETRTEIETEQTQLEARIAQVHDTAAAPGALVPPAAGRPDNEN